MRAVVVTRFDGPSAVEVRNIPEPEPGSDQVMIDVEYAGVSFPDLLHTRGSYQVRPSLPFTPGWEVAGAVRADAHGLRAGERVCAITSVGGFAESVVADRAMVFPLPDSFASDRGAALPLNYLTAHFALVVRGRIRSGETLVVHGASGGVGTAACQLAAALGATVIGVVSDDEKASVARQAGAHHAVLVDGFRDVVLELTAGQGADVVLDPVGGSRFDDSLRSLGSLGRMLVVGFAGGEIPRFRVEETQAANISVQGVGVAEYWRAFPDAAARQWMDLLPLVQSGELAPVIGSVHRLDDAAAALLELEQRRAVGKVLLRVR
jgi:NADPH:quinone reductase